VATATANPTNMPEKLSQKEKAAVRWRITAWELFATTIFLILEFYFVWSSSHIFTWILATVTVAGSLFLALPMPIGLTVAAIAMAAGLGTIEFVPPMPLAETETHGWLGPANEPSPPDPCAHLGHPIPQNAIAVYFGSNAAWTDKNKEIILKVHGRPLITYERNGKGEITFNADIFNDRGDPCCSYTTRRVSSRSIGDVVSRAKRGSKHPDVHDQKGNEVLYLKFTNPAAIQIRGVFNAPGLYTPVTIEKDFMSGPFPRLSNNCFMPAAALFTVK
jgi:hypothetical protein